MKRAFKIAAMTAALGFCIGWMVGCTVTTNPPTAPVVGQGYVNIDDQQLPRGRSLSGGACLLRSRSRTAGGRDTDSSPDTPVQRLPDSAERFRSGDWRHLALNYHNSPTAANLTATNTAVTNLTNNQDSLTAAIMGGK